MKIQKLMMKVLDVRKKREAKKKTKTKNLYLKNQHKNLF